MSAPGLTPEHLERLRRIAKNDKRSIEQVLWDAVNEYWLRWGSKQKLKPEEW
jgi:hypothetical protein